MKLRPFLTCHSCLTPSSAPTPKLHLSVTFSATSSILGTEAQLILLSNPMRGQQVWIWHGEDHNTTFSESQSRAEWLQAETQLHAISLPYTPLPVPCSRYAQTESPLSLSLTLQLCKHGGKFQLAIWDIFQADISPTVHLSEFYFTHPHSCWCQLVFFPFYCKSCFFSPISFVFLLLWVLYLLGQTFND